MIASGCSYYNIANGCIDSAGLPSEYQQVEYIQSNGNQYIDTNYIPNYNTKICARFSHNESVIDTPYFGVRNADRSNQYILWSHPTEFASSKTILYFNSKQQNIEKYSVNTIIYFECSNSSIIYKDQTFNWSTTSGSPSFNLYLFTLNTGGNVDYRKFSGKTWYFKIYDNNALVRNMIPCYRISDNEIGMYDVVNDVFYTNQGTGTFVKGPNVYNRYVIKEYDRPYISGHVTDGSSTFSFTVNTNQTITVPVDSNGDFKWYADRTITSLNQAFNTKLNISRVVFNCLNDVTDMTQMLRAGSAETTLTEVVFNNCNFNKVTSLNSGFNNRRGLVSIKGIDSSKWELCTNLIYAFIYCYKLKFDENFNWNNFVTNSVSDMRYAFADCRTIINESTYYGGTINCSNATPTKLDYAYMNCFVDKIILPIITSTCTVTNAFDGALRLADIEAQSISKSLDLKKCSRLNKQSIINLINASQASISYTLHATPYAKCASGGEWYTDVQAAINAKALEGYTVTLISA